MTAFRRIAAASILFLGFGAVANAQPSAADYWADYSPAQLVTGRSAYVDRAPVDAIDADQIVMGLRVPNGPRYR